MKEREREREREGGTKKIPKLSKKLEPIYANLKKRKSSWQERKKERKKERREESTTKLRKNERKDK